MATIKGPLYSETAAGTIGETLVFSTGNGFQRVQAKKLKYNQIKHRYFDNQTLIQWSAGLIKQYPTQIATIYKPLATAAGLPVQAFMVKRLRYCLRNQLTLRLPTNTLGTNVGSGAWLPKVIKTKTRIIVCPPAFPAAGYDGWIITMVQSTTNALNRTQVSGYTTGGTWSTTEWWPFTTFRLSFILLNSQTGTHQTNRLYATITT
jgi:hypothetical protein